MNTAVKIWDGLGLKLPGDIGKIIVTKKQSTFCTNVPQNVNIMAIHPKGLSYATAETSSPPPCNSGL